MEESTSGSRLNDLKTGMALAGKLASELATLRRLLTELTTSVGFIEEVISDMESTEDEASLHACENNIYYLIGCIVSLSLLYSFFKAI
mgnify:CR=1 FL=1